MNLAETPVMRRFLFLLSIVMLSPPVFGASWGANLGFGLPYFFQAGANYVDLPNSYSAEARLNFFTLSAGVASIRLTKPEINIKWHPFQGAFFVGLGLGHQIATATATEPSTGAGVKYSVSSTVATTSLGWLWGLGGTGIFGGLDFGYQNPYHVYTTVDSDIPNTDNAFEDAEDAAIKFGQTGLPLFTFLRVGYLF